MCSLNAGVSIRKDKKEVFRRHVAVLKAATAAGKDWRAQLRDSLKMWDPEFHVMTRKERRVGIDDTGRLPQEMQVDPAQL